MPYAFVLYPNPLAAEAILTPDGHPSIYTVPYTAPDGRPGAVAYVPDGVTSGHGAELQLTAAGYLPSRVRGFLVLDAASSVARLQVDDYTLTLEPQAPPPTQPPPTTGGDPASIINSEYATGKYNLATHEGCGQFTEGCLARLMAEASPMWGHILKTPGQNQYQGHAVDALMLLAGPGNGIFDIIQSSVSPEAKPQYIRQGDPDPDLWYQPTAVKGISLKAAPTRLLHYTPHPNPQ